MKTLNNVEINKVNGGFTGVAVLGMFAGVTGENFVKTVGLSGLIVGSACALMTLPTLATFTLAGAQAATVASSNAFATGAIYGMLEGTLGYGFGLGIKNI